MSYREILKAKTPTDPGRVFYTITAADVGKAVIMTEIGAINVCAAIGRVMHCDVGKRLYRITGRLSGEWLWQAENNKQRDERLGK
jgi:hypothetical protein